MPDGVQKVAERGSGALRLTLSSYFLAGPAQLDDYDDDDDDDDA